MDVSAFSNQDFDTKEYINGALKGYSEDSDRRVAELEMRLHLAAEDVSLYLQDYTLKCSQRIPTAIKELMRIREDAMALRTSVATVLAQLQDISSGPAADVIHLIQELDVVKQRMEAGCSTLQQAAGLSSLFQRAEELFASRDLSRIAEAITGMRKGISVVGESVPEFRGAEAKLAKFEERFAHMLEERLSVAMSKHSGSEVSSLAFMLEDVGRGNRVAALYIQTRLQPLMQLWEEGSDQCSFVSWLHTFYSALSAKIEAEMEWCRTYLPRDQPALVVSLIISFLQKISNAFKQRLNLALSNSSSNASTLLETAMKDAQEFGTSFADLNASRDDQTLLYAQLLSPLEYVLENYPKLVSRELQAEFGGSHSETAFESVPAIKGSIGHSFAAIDSKLQQCIRITEGTSLPALIKVIDVSLQNYLRELEHVAVSKEKGTPELVIPLLLVISLVRIQLTQLEENVKSTVMQALANIREINTVLSPVVLRLQMKPVLKDQLSTLCIDMTESSTRPLPMSSGALTALERLVATAVIDALISNLRAPLLSVSSLAEWKTQSTSHGLPIFTPYPLPYITGIGEHLMLLPQLIENSLLSETADEGIVGELVPEWVERTALLLAQSLSEEWSKISTLTHQGAAQLSTDAEYFSNVLSTLGVPIPPTVAAWQASTSIQEEDEVKTLVETIEVSEARRVVEMVCKLRHFNV